MIRLPRRLHPGSWWLWALCLVFVATRTTNPLVLAGTVAVCGLVVAARRPDSGWARGYRAYLVVAAVVIVIRTTFRILLGGDFGERVLFALPELVLPGISGALGGTVTLEAVLAGLYDGLRLGTIVVCVGAANTLADPRRLAGAMPRAVGAMATSVVVALALAPQLVESLTRVRRARRLRGETGGGWRRIRSLLVPVLEDSLHRSLALAASMDSRGYGRWEHPEGRERTRILMWAGLAAMATGMFTLLTTSAAWLPLAILGLGVGASGAGIHRLGMGLSRTRYRPEPWEAPEWSVVLAGVAAAVAVAVTAAVDPAALRPSLSPLSWPGPSPVALVGLGMAALAAFVPPPVPARLSVEGAGR